MRKLLYFVVTAGLVAATTVALASASSTAPRKASATPAQETANAYLPKGVAPAVNNWLARGGDIANSGFSQLKQITSANVAGLKNVWNASFSPPTVTANPQSQPICCPNDMMIQVVWTGVVAVDPGDGHTLWAYQGPQFNTVRAATNQVNAARASRGTRSSTTSTPASRTARSSR